MARYTVRVELYSDNTKDEPNYDHLHEEMAKVGFDRFITRFRRTYQLPTGLYVGDYEPGENDRPTPTRLIRSTARKVWKHDIGVTVNYGPPLSHTGLRVVTPATKVAG